MASRVIYTRAPRRSNEQRFAFDVLKQNHSVSETLPLQQRSTCEISIDNFISNTTNNDNNNKNNSSSTYNTQEINNSDFCDVEKNIMPRKMANYDKYCDNYINFRSIPYKNSYENYIENFVESSFEEIYTVEDNGVEHAINNVSFLSENRHNVVDFGKCDKNNYNNSNKSDVKNNSDKLSYYNSSFTEDDEENEDVPRISIISGKRNDQRVHEILYGVLPTPGSPPQLRKTTEPIRTSLSSSFLSTGEKNLQEQIDLNTTDIPQNRCNQWQERQSTALLVDGKLSEYQQKVEKGNYITENQMLLMSDKLIEKTGGFDVLKNKHGRKKLQLFYNEPIFYTNNKKELITPMPKQDVAKLQDWTPTQGQFNSDLLTNSSVINNDFNNTATKHTNLDEKYHGKKLFVKHNTEIGLEECFFDDIHKKKERNKESGGCEKRINKTKKKEKKNENDNNTDTNNNTKDLQLLAFSSDTLSQQHQIKNKKRRPVADFKEGATQEADNSNQNDKINIEENKDCGEKVNADAFQPVKKKKAFCFNCC